MIEHPFSALAFKLAIPLCLLFIISPTHSFGNEPRYSDTEALALSYGGDVMLYRMAYVAAEKAKAEQEIRSNPRLRTNQPDAQAYLDQKVADARTYVTANHFRNGWIEAVAKGLAPVVGGAVAGTPFLLIPKEIRDQGIISVLDMFERKAMTPTMDGNFTINMAAQVLQVAKDPNNRDYQWSRELVRDFLGLDPALDYKFLPSVRNNIRDQKIQEALKRLNEKVKAVGNDTAKIKELMDETKKEVSEIMGDMAKAMAEAYEAAKYRRTLTPEQRANLARYEKYKAFMSDVSSGLGAMAGIATLLGDQKAAEFFQRAAALAEGISSAIDLAFQQTAETPATYANVYVGIAILAMNLINASKTHSELATMMAGLNQLAEQIENLRAEMHYRFDILDYNSRRYFERTYLALDNLAESVATLQKDASLLGRQIEQMRFEMLTGLNIVWQSQMSDRLSTCHGRDPSNQPFPLDPQEALRCRNFFATLAVNPGDLALTGVRANVANLGELTTSEYSLLRESIRRNDPNQNWEDISVHPYNWIMGAQGLLTFLAVHPEYKNYANHSGGPNIRAVTLGEMITTGGLIKDRIESLALKRSGISAYSFKKELFEAMLKEYREQVRGAIYQGNNIAKNVGKEGPKPSIGLKSIPPRGQGDYPFFIGEGNTIDTCEGVPPKVNVLSSSVYPDARKNVRNPTRGVPDFTRVVHQAYLEPFNRSWFRWNATFLPLIPNSVLWGVRTNFEGITLKPCFRSIEIVNFTGGYGKDFSPAGMTDRDDLSFRARFNLEFQIRTARVTKPVVVARAVMDTGQQSFKFRLGRRVVRIGAGPDRYVQITFIPLVQNLWNGQHCDSSLTLQPCNLAFEAIADKGYEKFVVQSEEKPQELKDFEERFTKEIEIQAGVVKADVKKTLDARVELERSKQLLILASLGLDPARPEAVELTRWFADEDALPTSSAMLRFASEAELSPEEVLKLVDERINEVRKQLDKASISQDLRPRSSEIQGLIDRLKGYQSSM